MIQSGNGARASSPIYFYDFTFTLNLYNIFINIMRRINLILTYPRSTIISLSLFKFNVFPSKTSNGHLADKVKLTWLVRLLIREPAMQKAVTICILNAAWLLVVIENMV